MPSTFDSILSDLKNRKFKPLYVLTGEEPYYIDVIADYIEKNVLQEQEKEFNQSILYGADIDVPTLLSYVKRYPMMAEYQVVIVREAQKLDDIEDLGPYFDKPLKSTILVLCYKYKKLDKRKSYTKHIEKNGEVLETKKLFDNQLPEWISQFVRKAGYTIDPKAASLIADYVGSDLSHIVMEISKLTISLPIGTHIKDQHVENNIGISKEFNVFELQKALGEKNIFQANKIAHYMMSNPKDNPMVVTLTILFQFFTKLLLFHELKDKSRANVASALGVNPFFVIDYQKAAANYSVSRLSKMIDIIHEYDLKVKGINNASTGESDLLQEMIWKILH